jgi:asparagine synthase (glutamine-hydrolysing)
MCGVAGVIGRDASDRNLLDAMSRHLEHRGPDADGCWVSPSGSVGFVHRRLAVVGLGPEGEQPMASPSGRYMIVYNGEVYNHIDLRRSLGSALAEPSWRGDSDTETLLACFDAWGIRTTLERAVGMWAFAVWDRAREVLTLVRDRLGEKPRSYVQVGGTVAFASQPGAFATLPGFKARIDPDALAGLLRFGHVSGDRGIHMGVRKVPPGTMLEIRLGGRVSEPTPYWSFMEVAQSGVDDLLAVSDSEAVEAVGEALERSVRGQMLADVPLGAFLSGGIDSSLVVATMRRVSSLPVRTFTIGFSEKRFDESGYAQAIASHLGTDHTELIVTARDALDMIPEIPAIYDEPFADPSQIPTTLVSRLARQHVTVALSGDGGDELFGGYTRYQHARLLARLPRLVGIVASALLRATDNERQRSAAEAVAQGEWSVVRRLLSGNPAADRLVPGSTASPNAADFRAAWEKTGRLGGVVPRFMALDTVGYLPGDILHKVDRAAMSASLETRVPLLDHRLVELAWRLPLGVKVRGREGKWVLHELLARDVPRSMFERPKSGFGVPVGAWLRGPLRPWAEDPLSAEALQADGLLNVAEVRRVWEAHLAGRWDAGHGLWPVLMFQAWSKR